MRVEKVPYVNGLNAIINVSQDLDEWRVNKSAVYQANENEEKKTRLRVDY